MNVRTITGGILAAFLLTALFVLPHGGLEVAYAAPDSQSSFDCNSVSEIPADECNALVDLYNSTSGASWADRDGWLQDNTPCDWHGLTCNSAGRVSRIYLDQNGLAGSLPNSIGNLSALTWLQMNGNQLTGAIPATLGNLDKVTWLRLEDNQLSGSIPAELGNLDAAVSLYLSNNRLTGTIPAALGQLPKISKLYLAGNPLSGSVPAALGNLSTLKTLLINNTDLSGPLPSTFVNLQSLDFLHLLGTDLCEPSDATFQNWINSLDSLYSPGVLCQGDPGTDPTNTPTATSPPSNPATSTPTSMPTSTPRPANTSTPTSMPTSTPTTPSDTGGGLCEGLVTDLSARPMTYLDKPGYLQTVTDREFGTTIRRITDIEATVTGERAVIKPMYNTVQAWNADESYMILYQRSVGHQLFDGITYEYIRNLNIRPADLEEVFWHFSNPDLLFYVEPSYINDAEPGQRLMRYSVSNDRSEVVRSFDSICTLNEGIEGGNDVQMMSWDSDLIGLRCVNNPGRFFNYRLSTDTLSPVITSGQGNNYQPWYAAQTAPSGNLLILDNDVLDTNMNFVRELNMSGTEHSSLGQLANGNDALFTVAFAEGPQGGCGAGALIAHDMTDGTCRTLVGQENGYPYPPSGTHMSALSHRNPGWVAVSMVGVANAGRIDEVGQRLLDNELLLVNSAPGGEVCRVGRHRSYDDGGQFSYWAEPHVVISPSGTRLLFGSDWLGGPSVDSYVVELPSFDRSLSVLATPLPTSMPTLSPTSAPTVAQTSTPVPTSVPVQTPTPAPSPSPSPSGEQSGIVEGQVFEDINGNGNYDSGEPALANITVVLIDVTTAGQTTTISTETDSTGSYRFVNLQNVDYRISFVMPLGTELPAALSNKVIRQRVGSVEAPFQNQKKFYLPFAQE